MMVMEAGQRKRGAQLKKTNSPTVSFTTRGNLFSMLSPETPPLRSSPKGGPVAWGAADVTGTGGRGSEGNATVESE